MKPSAKLRRMLENGETVVVPGIDDPLGAKMARELGFAAAYVGSYSLSARMLGQPDAGYVTQTEMAKGCVRSKLPTSLNSMAFPGWIVNALALSVRLVVQS